MNKTTLAVLAAIGMTQANDAQAMGPIWGSGTNDQGAAIVSEEIGINQDTVRVLKMFSDMGALQFDIENGSASVIADNLPNALIGALVESDEVVLNEETDSFDLTPSFLNALASKRVLNQLGRADGMATNAKILEKLKKEATPVLRDDVRAHSEHSFISGH
jgi:hypothetical protein